MPVSQNPPHKHHFIPKFWIKNWEGKDNLVQRFTKPYEGVINARRTHRSSVGWVDKLYLFPHYNKTQLDFESIFFRIIDQRASDLFLKLKSVENPNLSNTEMEVLSVFLMTLLHRSPSGIAAMRKLSKRMLDEIRIDMRPRYPELRGSNDPVTVEEYEEGLGKDAHLDHFASIFRTVVLSERVAQFLSELHWRKVIFQESEHHLLLSDDPLIRTNGLANPKGHIAFPLTPRIAMVGVYESNYYREILSQDPRLLVNEMNSQAAGSARHFVVDVDDRQSRFVRNRFGKKPRPTISEQSLGSKEN